MKTQNDTILKTLEALNFTDKMVGVYLYGSRVYGTATETSDWDFVVILDKDGDFYDHYQDKKTDIHFMSPENYKKQLEKCDIMALECFYQKDPILKYEVEFTPSLPQLRKSISAICSNSWVKAKKKVNLEGEDNYIGYKSLFHSFRILMYGIYIARSNTIESYDSMNFIWETIMTRVKDKFTIEEIMEELKPLHNQMATEFRSLAPKE